MRPWVLYLGSCSSSRSSSAWPNTAELHHRDPVALPHSRSYTMAVDAVFNQRRRRRRRRRQDKPAISARLLPDERLKGEVGLLSEDLFHDLFPAAARSSGMPQLIAPMR